MNPTRPSTAVDASPALAATPEASDRFRSRPRFNAQRAATILVVLLLGVAWIARPSVTPVEIETAAAQQNPMACPPNCPTPIITPAWHMHMCDEPYQEQLDDNHCMHGNGVTEFPAGTNQVYIIYCHQLTDTVVVQVHDSGGGLQWANHPDGITYSGVGCETLVYGRSNGIPAGGSPYRSSAYWPEGPFTGVGAYIEWFIGLFISFDQDNYYGNQAEANISARDPGANADPTGFDEIDARVTSTSDPVGIAFKLREQNPGFSSVFKSVEPLRFSQTASDEARGVIKVANRDVVKVEYCSQRCYSDTAVWYNLSATVTPTPLPTWAGPAPTATATPPPGVRLEYITLRPAPADVGYGPQVSSNKDRKNHLGYPTIYSGMWTRGTNPHYGMIQFDLSPIPQGARFVEGRLELVGRESRFTKDGTWMVRVLEEAVDAGWRELTFDDLDSASVVAEIGQALTFPELGVGRRNSMGLGAGALEEIGSRTLGSRKLSIRIDGPSGDDNNLFAWESGVDVYNRAQSPPDPALGPALHLAFTLPGEPSATPLRPPTETPASPPTEPQPSATLPPGVTPSVTPTPGSMASPTIGLPTLVPSATPDRPPGNETPTMAPPGPTEGSSPTPSPTATGPAEQRQVCVLAYLDDDFDGARGPQERFLAGVTLRLTHMPTGVFDSWTTDGANFPDHCWSGLIDGEYSLEALSYPRGLAASGRSSHRLQVPFPGEPSLYTFGANEPPPATHTPTASPSAGPTEPPMPTATPSPTPAPTVEGPSGEICMAIYLDRDESGSRDPGEILIANQRMQVLDVDRNEVRALRSLADRHACTRLPAGVYYARVEAASGYRGTTPAEEAVLLSEGVERLMGFGWSRAGVYLPMLLRNQR